MKSIEYFRFDSGILIVSISSNIMVQLLGIPVLLLVIILVGLMGLSNTLCWPVIWPMTLQDLGGYTKKASSILIMEIIGGAIFPLIYGSLAETINLANKASGVAKTAKSGNQITYLMLLPTYLMILFYAFKGHKYKSWPRK